MASDKGDLKDAADIQDLVHQEVGDLSSRMAALTDNINLCCALLDDLKALKNVMGKALPDVYLKSQPEPGEPLPKKSP